MVLAFFQNELKKRRIPAAATLGLLSLALCSCGKKMDQNTSKPETSNQIQSIEASIIKLANNGSELPEYTMPEIGNVIIPPYLEFISGDETVQTKLYFNYDTATQFHCLYGFKTPGRDLADNDKQTAFPYSLISCYSNGREMGLEGGFLSPLYAGDIIKIENSNAQVSAEVEVDWH